MHTNNAIRVIQSNGRAFVAPRLTIIGNHNTVNGMGCTVRGDHNMVNGMQCVVEGNHNTVTGMLCTIRGSNNTTSGMMSSVIGDNNDQRNPKKLVVPNLKRGSSNQKRGRSNCCGDRDSDRPDRGGPAAGQQQFRAMIHGVNPWKQASLPLFPPRLIYIK